MGKLTSLLDWVGRANAIAWAWSCIPSSVVAAVMGWITHYAEQQAWVVGLVVIASFMMVSIALAAWRSHRISSVSQSSFDELKKRAYDAELALLTGKENARVQMVRNKGLQSPMLQGLDLARGLGEAEEEREAHRQAKLDRIRKGEE